MKDTGNEQSKTWKIIGTISVALIAIVSTLYFVKYDFIPNFDSWVNPFHVREAKNDSVADTKQTYVAPTPETLLNSVNAVRAEAGVAPLSLDPKLNLSAQIKADDMKARNYFAHADPDGKHGYQIAQVYAPDCIFVSENITDSGLPEYNTVEAGVSAWVESPPHYRAMIDPKYTLTGFGITSTGIVEHFCQL